MQNKLVIAALIGAIDAKGLDSLHNLVVKSKQAAEAENTFIGEFMLEGYKVADKPVRTWNQLNDAATDLTIIEGVLKGALHAEDLEDLDSCFTDVESIAKDARAAFDDFKTRDVQHVTDGIKEVAELLQKVASGLKDCATFDKDIRQLEDMVAVFSSPESFAYHVGKDLLLNGVSIFKEIEDSIDAYQKKDWARFGEDIGEAAAKTLLGSEQQKLGEENPDKVKLAKIEQGILKAYGGKFDLYALLECIGDEDQSILLFDTAVQEFEFAFQNKSPGDALAGIIATIAGVKQFKAGIPACQSIDTSSFSYQLFESSFDSAYDLIANPTENFEILEDDLLMNGVSIKRQVRKALRAYHSEQYTEFGFHLGSILELTTRPVEEKTQKVEDKIHNRKVVTEVAQGFLSATHVAQFNFTDLLMCIFKADQSALILYSAVDELEKAFTDRDPKEMVEGIVEVIAFIQQLKQSIPICESVDQNEMDWTYFNHIVDIVESPEKHMQLIDEDVMFNEVAITKELSESFDAYRSERFNDFGYKLGQIMYLATETPENLTLY